MVRPRWVDQHGTGISDFSDHLADVASSQEVDLVHWEKSISGTIRKSEWINFFEGRGFRAGVDFPVALF